MTTYTCDLCSTDFTLKNGREPRSCHADDGCPHDTLCDDCWGFGEDGLTELCRDCLDQAYTCEDCEHKGYTYDSSYRGCCGNDCGKEDLCHDCCEWDDDRMEVCKDCYKQLHYQPCVGCKELIDPKANTSFTTKDGWRCEDCITDEDGVLNLDE